MNFHMNHIRKMTCAQISIIILSFSTYVVFAVTTEHKQQFLLQKLTYLISLGSPSLLLLFSQGFFKIKNDKKTSKSKKNTT